MPDILADVPAVWFGVTLASTLFLAAAVQLPSAAPGPAATVADTIDRVAAAPYDSTATHPITADAVRVTRHRVAVRTAAGVTHATLSYGPVTAVRPGTPLARVTRGAPVTSVFPDVPAFRRALRDARTGRPEWYTATDQLTIRHLTFAATNVTLVTA